MLDPVNGSCRQNVPWPLDSMLIMNIEQFEFLFTGDGGGGLRVGSMPRSLWHTESGAWGKSRHEATVARRGPSLTHPISLVYHFHHSFPFPSVLHSIAPRYLKFTNYVVWKTQYRSGNILNCYSGSQG